MIFPCCFNFCESINCNWFWSKFHFMFPVVLPSFAHIQHHHTSIYSVLSRISLVLFFPPICLHLNICYPPWLLWGCFDADVKSYSMLLLLSKLAATLWVVTRKQGLKNTNILYNKSCRFSLIPAYDIRCISEWIGEEIKLLNSSESQNLGFTLVCKIYWQLLASSSVCTIIEVRIQTDPISIEFHNCIF